MATSLMMGNPNNSMFTESVIVFNFTDQWMEEGIITGWFFTPNHFDLSLQFDDFESIIQTLHWFCFVQLDGADVLFSWRSLLSQGFSGGWTCMGAHLGHFECHRVAASMEINPVMIIWSSCWNANEIRFLCWIVRIKSWLRPLNSPFGLLWLVSMVGLVRSDRWFGEDLLAWWYLIEHYIFIDRFNWSSISKTSRKILGFGIET